ncbi:MAG TPA: GMC family oxidoreductase [Gammaproteobacteria bacterium]|nr:GMC family oxidoreductase [Gammaproteobacteria bacterium]
MTSKNLECDVCVIGSGAGGSPVAYELAKAGYKVIVLEKGGWFDEKDFTKDEMLSRRRVFRSKFKDERHVLSEPNSKGEFKESTTSQFWGGNIVGGATNFMSAYFHRLKPQDFRLLSTFGEIEGANITDWPISYEDLEPYYTKVENLIGVSGKVVNHPNLEPRSTADYPFPPTAEHPIAKKFDKAVKELGYHSLPMARGILSRPHKDRNACVLSGYCGSFGCETKAKGSSRVALLNDAVKSGNCEVITYAKAYKINTDNSGNGESVSYIDKENNDLKIFARKVVVACYSIESSRLLLASKGVKHPNGIGNKYQQIGKNLHCCAGGTGHGVFDLSKLSEYEQNKMLLRGPFFNRALQDWYTIDDQSAFDKPVKGGTIDFVFDPPSLTSNAMDLRFKNGKLLWGTELKQRLKSHFTQSKDFKFEVFCDWLPNNDCHVSLDNKEKDKWGSPVAKVKAGYHPHDLKVAQYLVDKGVEVMKKMGADRAYGNVWSSPTSNLMAGGLRFGSNPETSALDANCRVHGTDNIYVTDGSFMPNGGSVTPTFTIYANSFRVADKILESF